MDKIQESTLMKLMMLCALESSLSKDSPLARPLLVKDVSTVWAFFISIQSMKPLDNRVISWAPVVKD